MDIEAIVESLKRERNRIDAAIAALDSGGRHRGLGSSGGRGRRRMSAEARARIAAAQRARWARVKAAQKKK